MPEQIREVSHTMEKEQALLMLGFAGSTHTAPDRHAVDVMTAILSGMAGRLFQAVREERGLSYTLGASHVPGWDPGSLIVYSATKPTEHARVLELLQEQLQLALSEGFTEQEVDEAKRYLIGLHRLDIQHLVGLARRCVVDELYGLGYDNWRQYDTAVEAVTPGMVAEAARRYLTLDRRAQVTILPDGNASPTQ
jgi:zinc protease